MLAQIVRLVGPNQAVELLGIRLVGVNAENGKKVLFSVLFCLLTYVIHKLLSQVLSSLRHHGIHNERAAFWMRQALALLTTAVTVLGLLSIWFNDPTRLATAFGLVTAGLAFALQRAVTAFAGYLIIMRGKTFNVGDRIMMGGVRGDVIALGFMQTTIMEMGQPIGEQGDPPAMWVQSRQYTGRIVTVTNDKIFDTPVFNYSRDFPYIWEEMRIPISFSDKRDRAEAIILNAVKSNTTKIENLAEGALSELERRYSITRSELEPAVYWRLTDNWLEMSVRFVVEDHGIRTLKDKLSRDILSNFEKEGISIASGTYQVVGMPPLKVQLTSGDTDGKG